MLTPFVDTPIKYSSMIGGWYFCSHVITFLGADNLLLRPFSNNHDLKYGYKAQFLAITRLMY